MGIGEVGRKKKEGVRVGGVACDLGDTRPHNLQVQADGETVAFVLFSAWARSATTDSYRC